MASKGAARAALHRAQQRGLASFEWGAHFAEGPGYNLLHTQELVVNGCHYLGQGTSIAEAQDDAAALALDAHAPGWRGCRADAPNRGGDAMLENITQCNSAHSALAYYGSISVELFVALESRADALRRWLMTDCALFNATDLQARVGAAVMNRASDFAPLFRDAVSEALSGYGDGDGAAGAAGTGPSPSPNSGA